MSNSLKLQGFVIAGGHALVSAKYHLEAARHNRMPA